MWGNDERTLMDRVRKGMRGRLQHEMRTPFCQKAPTGSQLSLPGARISQQTRYGKL